MTADPGEDVLAALARVVRGQRAELAGVARREGLAAEDAVDCVHDAFCTFLELALRGAGGPSTETLIAHAEECVRLRACVARLCQTQRTVVLMRLLEERPGEDVAAALGLTRGYVDVLLHRAKASLVVCMMEGS